MIRIFRYAIQIVCCMTVFHLLSGSGTCSQSAGEDMEILRMFYSEDELVVTATRSPKPISQTAENLSIITAGQIRKMNAHTVAEVLSRVPGIFVNFNRGFGAASLIGIQGSDPRQVLVALDGIPWNFLGSGTAQTNSIPVEIIERIEIIKGPASSAWGSSLGGVVNIITKDVGETLIPRGSVQGSYGEASSQDYRTEAAGKAGELGYYFYAGKMHSNGIDNPAEDFDSENFYSKFQTQLSENAALALSTGYSRPEQGLGAFPEADLYSRFDSRVFFLTAALNGQADSRTAYNLSFWHLRQSTYQDSRVLGTGLWGEAGDLLTGVDADESSVGLSGHLNIKKRIHNFVIGAEISRGELRQTVYAGPVYRSFGVPASSFSKPEIREAALYVNDTIDLGEWSLTAGLRFDYNTVTGSFVSPSLGMTYRVNGNSLLRAAVSRGFTVPPLGVTSGGGLFLDPNPDLGSEEIWSYQLGFETGALEVAWVKATLFRNDVDDTLERVLYGGGPPAYNDIFVNGGRSTQQGFELEAETRPFFDFSLVAGTAYVHHDLPGNGGLPENQYTFDLGVRYNDGDSLYAEIFGHYVWWNNDAALDGSYKDFIWDFNVTKRVWEQGSCSVELFASIHNLLNGSQYALGYSPNPDRWAEGGMRFSF